MVERLPTIDDVRNATQRIAGVALCTPLLTSAVLDERVGGRVLLKAECLQRIGAFKIRGAYNKMSQIERQAWPGGVVGMLVGQSRAGRGGGGAAAGVPR